MCSTTHSVTRKEMASFLEVNFALCTRRGCAATLRSFQAKTSEIRSATNVPLLFFLFLGSHNKAKTFLNPNLNSFISFQFLMPKSSQSHKCEKDEGA